MTESFLTLANERINHAHSIPFAVHDSPGDDVPYPSAELNCQSIVDKYGQLIGCELFISEIPRAPERGNDNSKDSATPIWSVLHKFSASPSPLRQKAFIRATPSLLGSSGINLFPCESLVLVLDLIKQPDARLIDRCRTLRDRGFSLALANYSGLDERSRALLSLLDSVTINLHECTARACREIAGSLSNLPITLLAQGIETADQMKLCQRLGFTFFQGSYVALPEAVGEHVLPLTRAAVLRMLQLVDRKADVSLIEDALKKETALLYRLLCLSLSFRDEGLQPPCTLRSVLVSIGLPSLAHWLRQHLNRLEADLNTASHSDLTIQLAALRGRMLELLAQKLEPNNTRLADAAYLAGCLSMIAKEPSGSDPAMPQQFVAGTSPAVENRSGQLAHLLDILDSFDRADSNDCEQRLKQISKGRWGYPLITECFSGALSWLTSP
ncbi:MAG: EAL domain-containing protein [Betaproteobacteria bacterium]